MAGMSRHETKMEGAGAAMHLRPFPLANRLIRTAPTIAVLALFGNRLRDAMGALQYSLNAGTSMIRSELLQKCAMIFPISASARSKMWSTPCSIRPDQLATAAASSLRGFGAFSTRQRDARTGRNPAQANPSEVDAKRVPYSSRAGNAASA